MSNPIIRIHDTQTDQVIDREMNAAELKQLKADQEKHAQDKLEMEAKQLAKSSLLERLGITADEAALLLS